MQAQHVLGYRAPSFFLRGSLIVAPNLPRDREKFALAQWTFTAAVQSCSVRQEGRLLFMKDVLSHFISAGTAYDRDRNHRAGLVFLEKRNQRLHEHRFEPRGSVRNVGLHTKIAN